MSRSILLLLFAPFWGSALAAPVPIEERSAEWAVRAIFAPEQLPSDERLSSGACALPLMSRIRADWDRLDPDLRALVPGSDRLFRPGRALGSGCVPPTGLDACLETEHFVIYYATSGDNVIYGWPDPAFRDYFADHMETAYRVFATDPRFRLREPEGTVRGSDGTLRLEILVVLMTDVWGFVDGWGTPFECSGHGRMVVTTRYNLGPPWVQAPLTGAHELFHVFQMASSFGEGGFLEESTARWCEAQVWPETAGIYGIAAFLESPQQPLWGDDPYLRIYGAAHYWNFLDLRLGPAPDGRLPAAGVWNRSCAEGWLPALKAEHQRAGREFGEALHELAVWNFFVRDASDGRHFPNAINMPFSRVHAVHTVYPTSTCNLPANSLADWTGTNSLEFTGRATRKDLRILVEGDPIVAGRRATLIATTRPRMHTIWPTVTADANGRFEWEIRDWYLFDKATVILTNPERPDYAADTAREYVYSAEETGDAAVDVNWPKSSDALRNAPDPFSEGTSIRVKAADGPVRSLSVFDASGRKVRDLLEAPLPVGDYNIVWNGDDDDGRPVATGLYFLVLRTETTALTEKAIVLR